MRIRCIDNKVREFIPSKELIVSRSRINSFNYSESYCWHCRAKLGRGPTDKLKPIWENHTCPR